jgi:CRP-like cAMP-binding protein
VIADGKAEVVIDDDPIGVVGPGECVGEMALLDRGPRTATVTAQTPMSVYVVSTGEFQALLEVSPIIARKIATTLARRLRAFETERPH